MLDFIEQWLVRLWNGRAARRQAGSARRQTSRPPRAAKGPQVAFWEMTNSQLKAKFPRAGVPRRGGACDFRRRHRVDERRRQSVANEAVERAVEEFARRVKPEKKAEG
jgi:hypothetical protein